MSDTEYVEGVGHIPRIPLQTVLIPEGLALQPVFRVEGYTIVLKMLNKGYDVFKDNYTFEVGHIILSNSPKRSAGGIILPS